MGYYHNVYWYPPDEGNYAHVAQRIADGEVLHHDVQDLHPGYINFIHAGALRLFGERLVSLRYPLILLAGIQAVVAALVLASRGPVLAVLAALTAVLVGMLLFPNPSANWYGLTIALLLGFVTRHPGRIALRTIFVVGALCGVALMFRQLTGAILGAAAIVWLLTTQPEQSAPGSRWLARACLLVVLLGTGLYAVFAADLVGFILFGAGPCAVCLAAVLGPLPPDRVAFRRLVALLVGVVLGVLPMLGYTHASHSWGAFADNTIMAAVSLPSMDVFDLRSYAAYLATGVLGLATLNATAALNGLFWLTLVSAPLWLGLYVIRQLRSGVAIGELGGVIVYGAFAGLLMAHFPSPLYIGAAAPVVGLALAQVGRRAWTIAACALLAIVSIGWQVGQARSFGRLWGQTAKPELVQAGGRSGLRVDAARWLQYQELLNDIQARTAPGEAIFAFPSHAELYFLADRRNPTTFFSFAQGVRDRESLHRLIGQLSSDPPRVVIYDPRDPLHTPLATELARWLFRNSASITRRHGFVLIAPGPNGPRQSRRLVGGQ